MASYIAFKLTRNDIIALELRKNMDMDKVLRLALVLNKFIFVKTKRKHYEIAWGCF